MQLALKIVVIVGGTQYAAAGRLAEDAKVWLETNGSTVEVVVVVDVGRCEEVIRVDAWRKSGALDGTGGALRAQYVEILRGDNGAQPEVRGWKRNISGNEDTQMTRNADLIWTDSLFLDLAKITGEVPVTQPNWGVLLHKKLLQEFGARFWRMLGAPLRDHEMS
ncbi:hypothetical protein BDW74DRAFT_155406 [Aspergillus multicolor]|uniref:uncharacterized protein n=1 Tax=Aspergillus multicolor TaxID=41759 RepID=UPI003CCD2070